MQEQVVISLSSKVVELACHPSLHSVIVNCIKTSSDQHPRLVRQVEVAGTEFGRVVIKIMKAKYSSLTGLWVVLLFCVFCYHSRKLRGNF